MAAAGVFLALYFALWFESLKLTTVGQFDDNFLCSSIVALLGGFLICKDRTTISTLIAIVISIIGVVMVGVILGLIANQSLLVIFLSVLAIVCYLLIGQNTVKLISHWIYSFFAVTLTI